jgi:D-glycero-alpha-D-manno-heptose-7-phosphate kinase
MERMASLMAEGIDILEGGHDIREFGALLHEAWGIKKSFGARISNSQVDAIYERAREAGAVGGKIAGAGGGGFMVLFVPPDKQARVRETLSTFIHVPFKFECSGSQVVYYDRQEDYGQVEQDLAHRDILEFRELPDADLVEVFRP